MTARVFPWPGSPAAVRNERELADFLLSAVRVLCRKAAEHERRGFSQIKLGAVDELRAVLARIDGTDEAS